MTGDDVVRGIQAKFRLAGQSLNERQRRQWAATQAIALGHGGIALVSQALRMSPNTIRKGIRELTTADVDSASPRIRRTGGGRKAKPASGNAGH